MRDGVGDMVGLNEGLNRRRLFYVIILIAVIFVAVFSYIYIIYNKNLQSQTPTSPTSQPTTYPTKPTITTNSPPLLSVSSLHKISFSDPVMRTATPIINGCLDIPKTYTYRCLDKIEKLIMKYKFNYDLSGQYSLNVYRVMLRYNESPIDYVLELRDNDNSIMLSLKNGYPYSIFKVYTWREFNETVKGFNPRKYQEYNMAYLEELLYNATSINLSLYGDPYIVFKGFFKDLRTIGHGTVDEISYTIGFKINGYDVVVASSPPYFKLSAYLYIQYNDKYVIVGFKWNHNPPVPRDNIIKGRMCNVNFTKIFESTLKISIKKVDILESKKVYFIKTLENDFYYIEGEIIKVSVKSSSGEYTVLTLFDLSDCSVYDYVAAKY